MALGFNVSTLSSFATMAMMGAQMYQMNAKLDAKQDMAAVNAEINGGKDTELDDTTEEGKIDPGGANFLNTAGEKNKPKKAVDFSANTYF